MPPGNTERRTTAPVSVCSVTSVPGALLGPRVSSGTSGAVVAGGVLLLLDHSVQGELATRVDLGEFDLDLLTHTQDLLDGIDPLTADQAAHLGDVQQAVLTRGPGHDR